jgi:hypothetical protein
VTDIQKRGDVGLSHDQALHSGVTTSLTIDPHGKCLSSELLDMEIPEA